MDSQIQKTGADPVDRPERSSLRGDLGPAKITIMVVAAAAPLTVMGGPALLGLGLGNGVGMPATFLVMSAVLLLFAVGFVAMTPFVKSAGAFYSYVQLGLGRGFGLGAGLTALVSYMAIEAGMLGLLGTGMDALVTSYGGPHVEWWIYVVVLFPIVTFLGYRNIELAGKVLTVLLVAEVSIVIVLDLVIAAKGGGPEGLSTASLSPTSLFEGSLGLALMFAILSFIGFEAAAVFRDEARDPNRTIPRATYSALIIVGVFYAFSTWAVISAVGDGRVASYAAENASTMLGTVGREFLGSTGAHLIEALFITSVFACILSFHNIASRYIYSLANRGVFSPKLAVAHPKYGSPAHACLAVTAICSIANIIGLLFRLDPVNQFYTWLGGVGALGFMVLMTVTCAAVVAFFRRGNHREGHSLWRTTIAPALGFLGMLGSTTLTVWNLKGLVGGSTAVAIAVVILIVGLFVGGFVVTKTRPETGMEQ